LQKQYVEAIEALLDGTRRTWTNAAAPAATGAGPPLVLGGYSADGRWLLVSVSAGTRAPNQDRDIWLAHLGGQAVPLIQRPGPDLDPTWDPDGKSVYFISAGGHSLDNTWGLWKVRIDPISGQARTKAKNSLRKPHGSGANGRD
jgi:Tol biopolymer transport system component